MDIIKEYSLFYSTPCERLNYYKVIEFSGDDLREEYAVISLFIENTVKEDFQIFLSPNNGSFNVFINGVSKLV
ncbi:MAG: hypothetical protein H7329_08195 [Opitutaceae bacterium]|nr:hypothetical protein [Cytophagales bacterium]